MRGGDTDYLRFILRYFAILRHGAPPIPDGVAVPAGDFAARGFLELCDNLDKQTEEFKDWSAEFAGLFAQHVDLPAGVTAAELAVLLAKIRANALGFPFSADGAVTLGWCLHSVAAAFNHSCRPNVCIVGDRESGALLARTISSVAAGAELCISYLDLVDAPLREVG
jgi:hypothetical protein